MTQIPTGNETTPGAEPLTGAGPMASAEPQRGPMSRLRLLGSFGATTALSGAMSVLSIPLIVLFTSTTEWGAVALGQAVGSSIGVLAMFGWGITGPAQVAMLDDRLRPAAYWDSIVARAILFVPAVILTIVITALIVPTAVVASTLCAVALAGGGLSGSWYLVGQRRPDKLFWLDTVPRVAGTAAGILVLSLDRSLVQFALLQLAGSLVAFLLVTLWAVPGFRRPVEVVRGVARIREVILSQRHGVALAVAVASYYPAVLAIVAGFAPSFLPLYALNEKLLRFATMAMQPVFQFFQASVPVHRGPALGRAIRRSAGAILVIALICWAGYTILLPVGSALLTTGIVKVPFLVALLLGAYMGAVVVINYMMSVALVAVDKVKAASSGSLLGSAAGLIVILLLALTGEGAFLSWGFVATAAFIIGYQVVILLRSLPTRIAQTTEPTVEVVV